MEILPPEAANPPLSPVPPAGVLVTDTAELLKAWASAQALDIILADGVYENPTSIASRIPHRLWAQHSLAATLRFGVSWGHPKLGQAGELHGLRFDVADVAQVDPLGYGNRAIVLTWGACTGLVVEDCTFAGNATIGAAIQAIQPEGLIVRRCEIHDFTDHGILAFCNGMTGHALTTPMLLEDLVIERIRRAEPGSSNGVGEAGLWLGHAARLRRFRIRDCAWAGVAIVNTAVRVSIESGDIDDVHFGYLSPGGRGIHCEQSQQVYIDRVWIGPHTLFGISCEWNNGSPNPYTNDFVPNNDLVFIRNAHILSYKIGVSFDLSVARSHITLSRFERQWRAAVLDNNAFPDAEGKHPAPLGSSPIQSNNAVDLATCQFRLASTTPIRLFGHHLGAAAAPPAGWPEHPDDYDEAALDVHEWVFCQTLA